MTVAVNLVYRYVVIFALKFHAITPGQFGIVIRNSHKVPYFISAVRMCLVSCSDRIQKPTFKCQKYEYNKIANPAMRCGPNPPSRGFHKIHKNQNIAPNAVSVNT